MKKDNVIKLRELMEKLSYNDDVDEIFVNFINARLSHELDVFMASLYQQLYTEAMILSNDEVIKVNVKLIDISANGNFKVYLLRVIRELDKILYKQNIKFDVDEYIKKIQNTNFEHNEILDDICRTKVVGVELFFRKSELIDRLNIAGYKNCYEFKIENPEKENLISSHKEIVFEIPYIKNVKSKKLEVK